MQSTYKVEYTSWIKCWVSICHLVVLLVTGHKYIYIMHDLITNYINAISLKSRKTNELLQGFKECYHDLKQKGFIARLVKLDNEISKEMVQLFEQHNLNYQLAAPGDHKLMSAKRSIQTFKNHFIAVRSSMDPNFLKQVWHHVLEHIVVTLNMLRPSRLNQKISVYLQLHGNFDFNKTPLAPAGCKIIIQDRTDEQPSLCRS